MTRGQEWDGFFQKLPVRHEAAIINLVNAVQREPSMAQREICFTCDRPIVPGWWPPCATAVKCSRCLTVHKELSFGNIVSAWTVWSIWLGGLVLGVGALVINVVLAVSRGGAMADVIPDVIRRSAGAAIFGGFSLGLFGAVVGGIVAFVITSGRDGNQVLESRYSRRYRCGICGFRGNLEASLPWGDASCPRCNSLLSPDD